MGWKRNVGIVAGLLGAGVVSLGGLVAWTFSGLAPLVDGEELPGGAHLVQDGYVAAYVVPLAEGGVALVDAGNHPDGAALLAGLKRWGAAPEDVRAILLTHGHPDHTGACARFPAATTYALTAELPILRGEVQAQGPLPRWFPPAPSGCPNLTGLSDAETVVLGGTRVTVFALPGHTAGSAAWRVGNTLYLGDSADGGTDGALLGAKWVFSDDVPQNHEALVRLASRVRGMNIQRLAFAHSGSLPPEALWSFSP